VQFRKCWGGQYQSVVDLDEDMFAGMSRQGFEVSRTSGKQWIRISVEQYEERLAECRKLLSLNGLPTHATSPDVESPRTDTMSTKD
jgi:hypothetical protein